MTINIRIFRKGALKEAYNAGVQAALADPSNWKDAFEAGEKKGAAWLNEAVHAKSFMEFMQEKRSESPGSFNSWFGKNEKRLSVSVIKDRLDVAAAESEVRFLKGKEAITPYAVEEAVREVYGISVDELRHNTRGVKRIKTPRYMCYYLAYFHCMIPLKEMAERWGDKDHATVIHGVKQIANDAALYDVDKKNLMGAYTHMLINGFDIDTIVQYAKSPRPGRSRTIVKPIPVEI